MNKYITVVFLLLTFPLFSQQNKDIIKESTYYFTLDSLGNFDGYGADFIAEKIAESQFFLIGEQHNIHAIETLVRSLVPLFKEKGYNHYVTEVGPVAAQKLMELNQDSISLKSYYSKYSSQLNLAPFGFFGTVEENKTLKELGKYGINLCGIDFENYASYLAIIDIIYAQSDKGKISENLYKNVYSSLESEYKKGGNNFNPDLMNMLLNSDKLKEFLFLAKNEMNNPVIKQFESSLKINHRLTLGFWGDRVDNMKNNFVSYYRTQKANEDSSKVFIKLGAVHTARGLSFSGNLEVGNLIYELANLNQSKTYSTIIFPRYMLNEETGEIEDLVEEEEKDLLKYSYTDKWTVIDLNKLKKLSIQTNSQVSESILSYMQKYDAIVLPPQTKYSEKIY